MILSRRISLDDVQLDSLDERIIISGFEEDPVDETFRTVDRYPCGSRITNQHISKKKITLKFLIRVKKGSFSARNEILEKITKWARYGHVMKSNTRPNRQIRVKCTKVQKISDPRNWTSEYQMTFEAMEKPYWEDTSTTSQTLAQDDEGTGTITVPGNADTLAEATIQNKSGDTIGTLELTINGYTMSFENLGLANNGYLTIDHTIVNEKEVLRIRIGNASKMACMSGDDEFILAPGENAISYSAEGDVIVTVSAKGRYV